ncbi:hypothetical protein BJ138DRAFT_1139789 [Hygrophoropsis aurantiaca]|uniref:Uncharacterized protein n=1 Tax=Hygrophoropsis aurantiaca TaxID=72124 RepID=A0ACB8ATD5_9AGAM|nr:hypothetical protein BJ138DRAFT_1139789 [Hygrophoropsis aurantiaca]
MDSSLKSAAPLQPVKIWWGNAIFFISVHIAAIVGVYLRPPNAVSRATLFMAFLSWQLADFGITIGYHRLYSHRAFRASLPVRLVLAALGSSAFQGSIKWWCLRHRLHHRFTDDPQHDPYAATRGLFYSHMGWIFFKPKYERLDLIDREDLENDPVVRYQHEFYVPLALFFGFIVPIALGYCWGDPLGAFIWGGLVSRLTVWHCTFLVNSLAHWDGLQPYSDEDTSRGNLILALLTGGEGNHNFQHAFPHDYRSGPSPLDWDPSKWIIDGLYKIGLVKGLRRARIEDIKEAKVYMHHKTRHGVSNVSDSDVEWEGNVWTMDEAHDHAKQKPGSCLVLIQGFIVDVTPYLGEHPGGAALLRNYSIRTKNHDGDGESRRDASWAFGGGLNNHSRAAKRRMRELRVARLSP